MADFVGKYLEREPQYWLIGQTGTQVANSVGGPTAPPTITAIAPSPATIVGTDDPLAFTITNATTRTIIAIRYPGLRLTEVVFDGTSFTERYAGQSTRTLVGASAYRYVILRTRVWPDAPEVTVFAFAGGAEL